MSERIQLLCYKNLQNSCVICFSLEECGRYLETIKVYENKPADFIQGQMDTDYLSRVICSSS